MTREDIIRMAKEAGWARPNHVNNPWSVSTDALERFAALVAAAEREACAKTCEEQADSPALTSLEQYRAKFIADAIRARGKL